MYMSVPIGPCGSYDPVIHYVQPYIAIGVGVVVGVGVGVSRGRGRGRGRVEVRGRRIGHGVCLDCLDLGFA